MSLSDDPVIQAGLDSIGKKTREATVGIYAIQDDTLKDHGSGVLFSIAGKRFIFTAAHVAYAADHGIPMVIASSSGTPIPLQQTKAAWHGEHGQYSQVCDVGVILLPSSIADSETQHRRFIRCEDVDPRIEIQEASYAIVGYPNASRVRRASPNDIVATLHPYVASPFRGEPLDGYDDRFHILLSYSEADSVDVHERSFVVPHPEGMSGGGIWILDVPNGRAWLAAIQSAYQKSREYAKGIWVLHSLRLIWKYWPELRPSLKLHFPPLGPND